MIRDPAPSSIIAARRSSLTAMEWPVVTSTLTAVVAWATVPEIRRNGSTMLAFTLCPLR